MPQKQAAINAIVSVSDSANLESLGKALAKNPAHRFATLAEMAKAVEDLGKAGQPATAQGSPASAAAKAPRVAVARRVVAGRFGFGPVPRSRKSRGNGRPSSAPEVAK